MKRTEQVVNIHFGDAYRIGLGSRQKNVVGLAIIHDLVVEEVGLRRLLVRGLGRCQSEVEDMFEGAFVTDASERCLRINREGGWASWTDMLILRDLSTEYSVCVFRVEFRTELIL